MAETTMPTQAPAVPEPSEKYAHPLNELVRRGFGCRTFLYNEMNAGRLRAIKMGARTLVLEPDLKAWLASKPTYQRPQQRKTKRRRSRLTKLGVRVRAKGAADA
jgi:hypothetical protein